VLRTNLSTRPFYNERAIHVVVGIAAVLVAALTVWNIVRVVTLSRQNTELATHVNADHAEAEQLTRMAAEIRSRIDQNELQQIVASARTANTLIDQRTFSWTAFFNYLEANMPPDVMLTSVRPSVRDGVTSVSMSVLARRQEDSDELIEKLEATGAFENVLPVQQDHDDGLYRVTISAVYVGADAAPVTAVEGPAPPGGAEPPAPPQGGVR
jgi:hypothetical protein